MRHAMLRTVLSALRGFRRLQHGARLRLWALLVVLRLRFQGCACTIDLGRDLRFDRMPRLKPVLRGRNGRVDIRIDDGVHLGDRLLIEVAFHGRSTLRIGAATTFERGVLLQLWGGQLILGERCEVRDSAVLKVSADQAELSLGGQVKVGRGVAVHCQSRVELQDRVTLAERVTVVDSFHDIDGSDVWTMEQPVGTAPVCIGANSLILSGAVIVHGTTIGKNAMVCANALVRSGTYPPGVVLLGNPARTVRLIQPKSTTPEHGE